MGDELDIEALLEAPFKQQLLKTTTVSSTATTPPKERFESAAPVDSSSPRREDEKYRRTDDYNSSSRRYHSSRSPIRSRYSSSSNGKDRDRYDDRHRRGSRSPDRPRDRSGDRLRHSTPTKTYDSSATSQPILTEAQRDRRTVFCRQLAQRLEPRELKEFCEVAGQVRDVKIVFDKISRRSKGVAYVELVDEESVPAAVALTGKKLLGIPIIIELTETEKNRIAEEAAQALKMEKLNQSAGAKAGKLIVENLHPSIAEADLMRVFQSLGEIISIKITREDISRASAVVAFRNPSHARVAADKLDNFMLMSRPLRLHVQEEGSPSHQDQNHSKSIAEDEFFAGDLLKSSRETAALKAHASTLRPSPAILLQHMYDPATEISPDWASEIAEEVGEECRKYGPVGHLNVAKSSDGDVFVRFSSTDSARAAQASLNGRWFGGKQINAAFIPLDVYLQQFPR